MMEWLLFRLFRRSILVRLLFIIGCLVLLFGMLIHFLEPQTFGNVFEGIWWVIITISTIRYDTIIFLLICLKAIEPPKGGLQFLNRIFSVVFHSLGVFRSLFRLLFFKKI